MVLDCMNSTWISSQGKYIDEFEDKVADYTGAAYAVAVSNGTVAIHLAMLALGIGPGDEVITTNFTYVASSNAILYVGATPIFADIDKNTWNLDPQRVAEKITKKSKAILYTNIYGTPAEYTLLRKLADDNGLFLIEDAAESFGATYEGKMSGTLGDLSTFSFFGNKTITTGEGGMVLTHDADIAAKLKKLKNQGNSESVRYYHDILGYNYRMTNIQAALGVAQIGKINQILQLKNAIQQRYMQALGSKLRFQRVPVHATSSYWMCSLLLNTAQEKEKVREVLSKSSIETRPFFTPIDELPFYTSVKDCPVSKEISSLGMNLPSYPDLCQEDQERIIEIILETIE